MGLNYHIVEYNIMTRSENACSKSYLRPYCGGHFKAIPVVVAAAVL